MSKQYATVTSEKASKGQGGQKYIDIIINNDIKQPIVRLFITNNGLGLPIIDVWTYNDERLAVFKHQGTFIDCINRLKEDN